jgi:hypothetical protein
VDKHSSFLSLSPGEELPALMHATAHRSDEVNYTMLVDLEEPMPHEVEFFCGATLFDGGPGGGPGAGGAFKRGESKLAKSKRGQNKLGKGKRSQSKRFRPQTVYTPRANDNKPDLGCVVCDAPAPWAVLFANRTVTQTPELPSCTEGDPVLLQLDPSDQHPPIELLELGVTPVVGFGPEVIVFGVHHSPATAANGIAVFVGVYGEPGEWAKQAILAVTAPGVVEVVLSEDDAVEGLEGYAYEAFGPPTINTSHQLVFHADVTSADQPAKAGIFSAWLAQEVTCPADFNGDGEVDGADLGLFLVEWGPCEGCQGDFNGDGHVDGADLGLFLVEWGPCAP